MEGPKMITVGLPAYNEEKSVAKTIASILEQISRNDQVLVVDNGSADGTAEEIKKMQKKDKRVKLLTIKGNNGKCPALNLIIKSAKSDIIVQTDADVVLKQGAIKALVEHFNNPKIGGVSGNPMPIIPAKNLFYEWTIMSYKKIHELRMKESREGTFWHLSGYLLAFRKKALKKVPNAKGAVDALMGRIISRNGYKMVYEPRAGVLVKCPTTIKDFINQKARVRAGYYFLSKRAEKAPRAMGGEILFFLAELMKIPLTRWHKFLFSAAVYAYAWVKGYYLAKTNKPLQQIWKVPYSTK
ncbi:glycosyltransferase [Candidatus Pacearchaeota archaeon]|nr:glycosyltransferase [Candidatus Pacearchaeota archaeon]